MSPSGGLTCDTQVRPTTTTQCGTPGSSTSFGKTTTRKFGIVVEVAKEAAPVGGKIAFEGGWESSSVMTSGHAFQEGSGNGQCVRWFTTGTTCKQSFTVLYDTWEIVWDAFYGPVLEIHPCAGSKTVTSYCSLQTDSAQVCARTAAD